jgi:hypothetical protein
MIYQLTTKSNCLSSVLTPVFYDSDLGDCNTDNISRNDRKQVIAKFTTNSDFKTNYIHTGSMNNLR